MPVESTEATTRIVPDGPSGFEYEDVLEKAVEGDEVYAEFSLQGDSGIYGVRGEVTVINSWMCEDGRTEGRAIWIQSDHETIREFKLRLMTDTKSAHNLLEDRVQVLEQGASHGSNRMLDLVHTIEVTKE